MGPLRIIAAGTASGSRPPCGGTCWAGRAGLGWGYTRPAAACRAIPCPTVVTRELWGRSHKRSGPSDSSRCTLIGRDTPLVLLRLHLRQVALIRGVAYRRLLAAPRPSGAAGVERYRRRLLPVCGLEQVAPDSEPQPGQVGREHVAPAGNLRLVGPLIQLHHQRCGPLVQLHRSSFQAGAGRPTGRRRPRRTGHRAGCRPRNPPPCWWDAWPRPASSPRSAGGAPQGRYFTASSHRPPNPTCNKTTIANYDSASD